MRFYLRKRGKEEKEAGVGKREGGEREQNPEDNY